jgi:hypothetical protein
VAAALPLLYGMAEQIVRGVAPSAGPDVPESGIPPVTRRSRLRDVGFAPPNSAPGG